MEKTGNKKNFIWLLHIAIWVVLFGMPFFSPRPGLPLSGGANYARFIPTLVSFIIVFYVNYLFLIRKYLYNRRFGMFILWNVILVAIVSVLVHITFKYVYPVPAGMPRMPRPVRPRTALDTMSFISRNTIIYVAIICVATAVKMTEKWYEDENRRKELEKATAEAELATLKSQVNPHFLFNTLNALYGLVVTKSDRAEDAFMRFIELEKYMVGNAQKDKVMVEDEFHFLSNYVHLQQLRLNEMTHVEFFYQNDMHQAEIAPMLLIPFVENAFMYGTSAERPCQIHFSLLLSADGILQFKSENEIFMTNGKTGTGTGIVNCRNRLELLYPNRHVLDIKEQDGKYYVCLTIHL